MQLRRSRFSRPLQLLDSFAALSPRRPCIVDFHKYGGSDGTRTRGPLRDRQAF